MSPKKKSFDKHYKKENKPPCATYARAFKPLSSKEIFSTCTTFLRLQIISSFEIALKQRIVHLPIQNKTKLNKSISIVILPTLNLCNDFF
jgi:hypothetical protein